MKLFSSKYFYVTVTQTESWQPQFDKEPWRKQTSPPSPKPLMLHPGSQKRPVHTDEIRERFIKKKIKKKKTNVSVCMYV